MDQQQTSLKGVYTLFKPQNTLHPILFDSPHSGLYKPDDFNYACSEHDIDSLADLFIDELFHETPQMGYTFLRAECSRAYIDFNRTLEDIDLNLLSDIWPYPIARNGRSQYGVGLVFRSAGEKEIYQNKICAQDIQQRINEYYIPYHKALNAQIDALYRDFQDVIHINCHSFPSKSSYRKLPDIVLGDRLGTTCAPHIIKGLQSIIEAYGYEVAINHPYQGQAIIQSIGAPTKGIHSVQIEINRKLYMNEQKQKKSRNFNKLKNDINEISQKVKTLLPNLAKAAD